MTKKPNLILLTLLLTATTLYAGKGKVRISADQQGAYIYVDGQKKAMTGEGFTSILLEEGEHEIKVEYPLSKDEFYVWRKVKRVFIGEDTSIKIKFEIINSGSIITEKGKYFKERRALKKSEDKKRGRWINKNNVLIDNELKVMWQDEPYTKKENKTYWSGGNHGKVLEWKYAKSYCTKLSLHGYKDWYLPSIKQLEALYNYREELKNLTEDSYLSSTVNDEGEVGRLGGGIDMDYTTSYDTLEIKSNRTPSYLRCVRNLK